MKPEYIEGPKAARNFERLATAIFKAPKADGRKAKKGNRATRERKLKSSDRG
jgi:hypothetical protein